MALTTFCSYSSGILLERHDAHPLRRKWICGGNILLNLLVLGYFKYYDFFGENFAAFFRMLGWEVDWVTRDILLPVGISFYTFQALSYTIDVYRREMCPTHDVAAFFAFISFFPQLVAGPIERGTRLLPQFLKPAAFSYAAAADGMRQILWGLFKKMVVADNCADAVNGIFADYQTADGMRLFLGALFFTFQIYGDFSGYSDIAIGTARLFGVDLMRNFSYPYFSRDIAEFWRRWHISLTTWFRDYLYIPLGGSRCARWKVMRNTAVVFLVSGLWHGADWTYVCWGAYHALLFFPLLCFRKNRKHVDGVAEGRVLPTAKEALQMLATFLLVVLGWVIFRAGTVGEAWEYIVRMFTCFTFRLPPHGNEPLIYIGVLLCVEWLQRGRRHGLQIGTGGWFKHRAVRWLLYYVVFITTFLLAGRQEEFIYFQF